MPIQSGDIQLLKSQVMDDVPEGGGRVTGAMIADGASNSIFPDVSELDRAYGRVNLRKAFVSVKTTNTDGYFGANVIIADPPDDQHVSVCLFSTGDHFDRRVDAQGRLESYVVGGPLSTLLLYGNQIAGQRALLCYQREEAPLPEVGAVLMISLENATPIQQFFRVTKVEASIRTFEDSGGSYTRRVVTIRTSDPLRATFPGADPTRVGFVGDNIAKVRATSVADAARYFGIRPLATSSAIGSFTVNADSIYSALVPSAESESPIVNATVQNVGQVVASGDPIVLGPVVWAGAVKTVYMLGPIVPRSLKIDIGQTNGDWPKMDDGAGRIVTPGKVVVGTVDYLTGVISPDLSRTAASWGGGTGASVTYAPGTNVVQSAFTRGIPVTLGNRGSVYVETLRPLPAPGTLVVDYMALGKWYRLADNGAGALLGSETAFGAGSITYATGAMVVTLGALPDVDSAIMLSWGTAVDTRARIAGASPIKQRATLNKTNVARNSVSVVFKKNNLTKTLVDNGAGILAGDGETGEIRYSSGEVSINGWRDPGAPLVIDYSWGDPSTMAAAGLARAQDRTVSVSLPAPVQPFSVQIKWAAVIVRYVNPVPYISDPARANVNFTVSDDGLGHLKFPDGVNAGSIDYQTGVVTWLPDKNVPAAAAIFQANPGPWGGVIEYIRTDYVPAVAEAQPDFAATITYRSTDSTTRASESLNVPLTIDLVPNSGETVLQNGLILNIGGGMVVDRDGTLYRDPAYASGVGLASGTIDYSAARVNLTSWPAVPDPVKVLSCLTALAGRTATSATFRTAGAPIRPASLYVQATTIDGETIEGTMISSTADQNGVISSNTMRGTINVTTGVVRVEFGGMVVAAGNETAPWYDPANVVNGKIFKPRPVFPGSIKYNAVVVVRIPLEAAIIGLDPVRLPQDGRVPIFRPGEMAVIHHTATSAPQYVNGGQTVNIGRSRLARVRVLDKNGALITTGYAADLDAGTVSFANTAGYAQPVTIENRIEDMALVSDAQINGSLTLTRPLTHDYPLGSFVSSALVIGDMRARVPLLFDQYTWDGAWRDNPTGNAATATFNDALAPIEVTNAGAITERWTVQFTQSNSFNVVGEHVGVIATGNISADCAPINPATGVPYFTIRALGWGVGWSAGNVVRFNTIGALYPIWIVRTISQGQATAQDDSFTLLIRGDIDRN